MPTKPVACEYVHHSYTYWRNGGTSEPVLPLLAWSAGQPPPSREGVWQTQQPAPNILRPIKSTVHLSRDFGG